MPATLQWPLVYPYIQSLISSKWTVAKTLASSSIFSATCGLSGVGLALLSSSWRSFALSKMFDTSRRKYMPMLQSSKGPILSSARSWRFRKSDLNMASYWFLQYVGMLGKGIYIIWVNSQTKEVLRVGQLNYVIIVDFKQSGKCMDSYYIITLTSIHKNHLQCTQHILVFIIVLQRRRGLWQDRQLDNIIMRNIRTRRLKSESSNFFAGPFQDSVLEIQLDKHRQCLTAIQKNQHEKAAELINQIMHDEALITLQKREQSMIEFLTVNVKAYLALRGGKLEEGMKCVQGLKGAKNKQDSSASIRSALPLLIKSCILCHQGKLEQSKQSINIAFQTIKNNKESEQLTHPSRNMQKYNQIFIIFFDMIAIQLSKMAKFSDILSIYKQSYHLSIQVLGKEHKLTCRMKSIIQQNSYEGVLSSKAGSSKGNRGPFTKNIRSKRKLKINQQKMPSIAKEQQMKRIYTQNDDILLGKIGANQNKLTKRDQTYYLKSLQRVKSIYNSRNQYRNQQSSQDLPDFSRDTTFYGKMATQSSYEYSRRRIKDIILKGRRLNKDMIYIREPQTESFMETATQNPVFIEESTQVHVEPVERQKLFVKQTEAMNLVEQEKKPELTFERIVAKADEARETRKECQLI